MTKPQIGWEKFIDPLGRSIKDVEWPGAFGSDNLEDYDEDDQELQRAMMPAGGLRVAVTPMGIIPLTEDNDPTKVFNLWVGHTNFNLSAYRLKIINEVPGVELLYPFSRYRFLVGIGRMFKSVEVKVAILQALGMNQPALTSLTAELQEDLSQIKAEVSQSPYWAVMILPNGKIDTIKCDSKIEYQDKIEIFQETQNHVGGKIMRFDDAENTE